MNVRMVNSQTVDFRKCGEGLSVVMSEGECVVPRPTQVWKERAESQSCPLARYAHHGKRVSTHKYILEM